ILGLIGCASRGPLPSQPDPVVKVMVCAAPVDTDVACNTVKSALAAEHAHDYLEPPGCALRTPSYDIEVRVADSEQRLSYVYVIGENVEQALTPLHEGFKPEQIECWVADLQPGPGVATYELNPRTAMFLGKALERCENISGTLGGAVIPAPDGGSCRVVVDVDTIIYVSYLKITVVVVGPNPNAREVLKRAKKAIGIL
ncbi:MAG: hypothetical protein ACR2RB_10835, partial [Gammaproteobacteria bacterium]